MSQTQEISRIYEKLGKDYGIDMNGLIHGKGGFMESRYPQGFPDFKGDVVYHPGHWDELEDWAKKEKGIDLEANRRKIKGIPADFDHRKEWLGSFEKHRKDKPLADALNWATHDVESIDTLPYGFLKKEDLNISPEELEQEGVADALAHLFDVSEYPELKGVIDRRYRLNRVSNAVDKYLKSTGKNIEDVNPKEIQGTFESWQDNPTYAELRDYIRSRKGGK